MELKEVYNEIAEDWSSKRQKPHPPEVLNVKNWKGKILDLGCGNCVNLTIFKDSELYGIDFSEKMINEAKIFCMKNKMKVDLRVGDIRKTPYPDKFFDYVIFSKSLQHLRKTDQLKALKEAKRILKGKCFLAVWNKDAPENKGKGKEIMEPWTYKGKIYARYYYLFDEKELLALVKRAGFKVEQNFTKPDSRNICMIISGGCQARSTVLA